MHKEIREHQKVNLVRSKVWGFRSTSSGLVGPERVLSKEGGRVSADVPQDEADRARGGNLGFPQKNKKKKLYLLGPAGSFSDEAADKFFKGFEKYFCADFSSIFAKVDAGGAGLVPVENALLGKLKETRRVWNAKKYRIERRVRLPVRCVLAARRGVALHDVAQIFAPRFAAEQCRKFLFGQFGGISSRKFLRSARSTSDSYKKIVQLGSGAAKKSAAIGSAAGARLYGLIVLARNIQDDPCDWTDFCLVTSRSSPSRERRPRSKRTVHAR